MTKKITEISIITSWMMSMALSIQAVPLPPQGQDLGFRYRAGICQNKEGLPGRNPRFLGECGELSGIDLSGEVVEETKLSGINLVKARLNETNFHSAELRGANLEKAQLKEAVFALGDVSRADFTDSNLQGAVFYWTSMGAAKLEGSDLREVDLRGASLQTATWNKDTVFVGAVFDEYTWLPFSREEAQKRGMVYAPTDRPVDHPADRLTLATQPGL